MRRHLLIGSCLSLLVILGLLGATLYANKGYPWPAEEEFKAEMVLVEAEYPGLLHALLTVDDSYGAERWSRIEDAFGLIDWDTWPWKEGAFYRQFNPPQWVKFFDSYELVPVVVMVGFASIAYWCWRKTRETHARPGLPEAQAA
jgi:hypothetical protein